MTDGRVRPHRDTRGKATLAVERHGDAALSGYLAEALAVERRDDDLTHGFHTYPAGLHPVSARALMDRFPGGAVRDPFCGGGTVLVEAARAGRPAFGSDLSPIAVRVATARTRQVDDAALTRLRSAARRITEAARHAREAPPPAILRTVESWYAPWVLAELEAIRRGVSAADPDIRALLEVVFSSVLIKVSWRRSDTSRELAPHHRPPGTAAVWFHRKVRELAQRLASLRAATPPGTPEAVVWQADARAPAATGPYDLVLTSPPYPGVYDYLPIQDLRAAWLGLSLPEGAELASRRAWQSDVGLARERWLRDTREWMAAAVGGLGHGGWMVIVIGDGLVRGQRIDALGPTVQVGRDLGLRPAAGASLARPDHARADVRWEHVAAFQRTDR